MNIIVTSYQRPKYLKQTLESLRGDRLHRLYVVDGGSDSETKGCIAHMADGYVFMEGNPGADVLKNVGLSKWGQGQSEVMVTSDDLVFPDGAVTWALTQYKKLRALDQRFVFIACNMDYIDKAPPRPFRSYKGVDILEVATCQVSGAIIDLNAWRKVGGFPVYGRSGQGDWAISKRLRDMRYRMCYLRRPCLKHLGSAKWRDYPDYSADFAADERLFQAAAKADSQKIVA
jgi:hypothetical protein